MSFAKGSLANLLPENPQLKKVARVIGVSQIDPLALLANIGRDTSGAMSFFERGSTSINTRPVPDEAALEHIIEELPEKPFLVGDDDISMSLAGAQSKIGVHLDDDGMISIPVGGTPSTWILKPDVQNLPGGIYNGSVFKPMGILHISAIISPICPRLYEIWNIPTA